MSDEHIQKSTSPEPNNLLQSRPQRRSRRGPATLLFLLGSVTIIGVVAIVAWQALAQRAPSASSNAPGTSATAKGNENGNAVPPGWNDPAVYWQTIRTQVAQELHLSVAQVTAKLRAASPTSTVTDKGNAPSPGAPMTVIAVEQGLTTDQLRTLELNALQKGCDAMVAQGKLSQADAYQRMQMFRGWDQGTLNWYVMHAFTGQ